LRAATRLRLRGMCTVEVYCTSTGGQSDVT
jgi:hypothetical protein